MKTLLLLRHAKSSWDDHSLDDFDRPLNERGRKTAPRVGGWMRKNGWVPDRVLCSAARRAMETWERMEEETGAGPEVEVVQGLYLAEPHRILGIVRGQDDDVGSVLVVGHNPGFEDLARMLATEGDPRALAGLGGGFPTGGLAIFRFPVERWSEVGPGVGRMEVFVRPRDLGGGGSG
jgi:phosphohistidine phosphatase